jgi:hypothetical protein
MVRLVGLDPCTAADFLAGALTSPGTIGTATEAIGTLGLPALAGRASGPAKDAAYLFSETRRHEKINSKVTRGLNRTQMVRRYNKLFPGAAYAPDSQTSLAYGSGVLLEQIIKTAQSRDAGKLEQAAVALNDKMVTLTGAYAIDETGRQLRNALSVMHNLPGGAGLTCPKKLATARPVYPVPAFSRR